MNRELLYILDQIERERHVEKGILIEALKAAVLSACKKLCSSTEENLEVRFDPQTGAIELFAQKVVVEVLTDKNTEILLTEAQKIKPEITVGDSIEVPFQRPDFGRIAAQTAKQVIMQRVREAERDTIYNEYKDRIGELVSGMVTLTEKGNIFVDLGKTEGIIPRREQALKETFRRGDRIKAFVIEVNKGVKGPQVILSRTHPGLLTKLFEMEVPEIYEGVVAIKGAVREISGRSKIAVASNEPNVDPVGACVGMRGIRVQAVVRELQGEKIDIVRWSPDPATFVAHALSPARISKVNVHEEDGSLEVIVPDDQLSLAIGKKGENVRLAAKLTQWKVDIKSEGAQVVIAEGQEASPLPSSPLCGVGEQLEEHVPEQELPDVQAGQDTPQ